MEEETSTEAIIMSALTTLTPLQLLHLTNSISSLSRRLHRRLHSILSAPSLFYLTLHHLHSLSLHHKSLLIARHLLSYLSPLITSLQSSAAPPTKSAASIKLRDLDATVLLFLLCEIRQLHPEKLQSPPSQWRIILSDHVSSAALRLSGIESSSAEIVIKYIDTVAKCKRFVNLISGGGGEKLKTENATSVEAIVALPSVEIIGGGGECAICKEGIGEGRDVCELPCHHLFHWKCILPWLAKRNTCPCCRHRLPTDDVFGEIGRLWEVLAKSGADVAFRP